MADSREQAPTSKSSKVSFGPDSFRNFHAADPPSCCNPMSPEPPSADGPKKHRKDNRKRKREKLPSGDIPNQCLPRDHKIARGRGRIKQLEGMTAEEKEAEYLDRMERNRRAAAECRRKKKLRFIDLENQVAAAVERDAEQKGIIEKLCSERDQLKAALKSRLGVDISSGSGLSKKEKCDHGIALRKEVGSKYFDSRDFKGAFCGADTAEYSGCSPIAFPREASSGDLSELGDLSDILPHADEPVDACKVLSEVSLTLRQVNGKLAEMGFITETVSRGYNSEYIKSVVQKVRLDPVLVHRPWPWWYGKSYGSTLTCARPSHVDPTVVLPPREDN